MPPVSTALSPNMDMEMLLELQRREQARAEAQAQAQQTQPVSPPVQQGINAATLFNLLPEAPSAPGFFDSFTGPGSIGEGFSIQSGNTMGPMTQGQSFATGAGEIGGAGVAVSNVIDALGNLDSRRGKGAVEGSFTAGGTAGGAILGSAVGAPGLGAGIGSVVGRTIGRGAASLGESLGVIGGKSTEEYKQERWGAVSKDNPLWGEVAVQGLNAEKQSNGIFTEADDPTGKYVGQQWSFEALTDIVNTTQDYDYLMNSLAHAETFGDRWHLLSLEKRREFISKAWEEGLYTPNKGSILFSGKKGDQDRAIELMNETLGFDFFKATTEQLNSAQAEDFRKAPGAPAPWTAREQAERAAMLSQNGLPSVNTNVDTSAQDKLQAMASQPIQTSRGQGVTEAEAAFRNMGNVVSGSVPSGTPGSQRIQEVLKAFGG